MHLLAFYRSQSQYDLVTRITRVVTRLTRTPRARRIQKMESSVMNSVERNGPMASTTSGPQTEIAGEDLNKILSTTAASLSIVGTLITISTFVMWPDLRTNSRRMIVFISIGDLFVAISNVLGLYNTSSTDTMCELQATLNIAAVLPSFFWTVYLSFYLYLTICKKICTDLEARVMYLFHVTAWGIPLLIAATAYAAKAVGDSNDLVSSGWCWIKYRKTTEWWMMVLWMCIAGKGWEILAYIAITVFYVLVKLQIRKEV